LTKLLSRFIFQPVYILERISNSEELQLSSDKFVVMQTQYNKGFTIPLRSLPKQLSSRKAEYIVNKTPRNIIKTTFF